MKSLKELYRIGRGPSSTHTMAPLRAMRQFIHEHPETASFRVTLFSSLAATGKGHLTAEALRQACGQYPCDIIWKPDEELPGHPNGMLLESLDESGNVVACREEYSTGGGALLSDSESPEVYKAKKLSAILGECELAGESFGEYVFRMEGIQLENYFCDVWKVMKSAIQRGLKGQGELPGGLGLLRKASSFLERSAGMASSEQHEGRLIAYAYAVAEENASGGEVVTAPSCGASGVLPAVLYSWQERSHCSDKEILHALATAGLFGNIVKQNASISGASVGCQGEIGTACAMAAAAIAQLKKGNLRQVEYAAEMGLEHHLGLTCDPVRGLVQIPCIERNAHAALRALNCSLFALLSDGIHRISFDDVVAVLWETGQALPNLYKETSRGGLARIYQ